MKENKPSQVKSTIISLVFGTFCGFLFTYWFSGNFYFNLIASLTVLFISQSSPEVFKQRNSLKRWIYSFIAALVFVPICVNATLWSLFALPIPFLITYFGKLTAVRLYYRKQLEASKCDKCGGYNVTYDHKLRKSPDYVNTTTNPAYRFLPNNIYHRK